MSCHVMTGYIIAEQHGIYPLFSGHNTICVVTALLETGQLSMVEPLTEFKLEAPGGLISIEAECEVTQQHCASLWSVHHNFHQFYGTLASFQFNFIYFYSFQGGRVKEVRMQSMPSFVGKVTTNSRVSQLTDDVLYL